MHKLIISVRDNETYVGGIVHNSHYFNYLECARNTALRENGIDFFLLASERGIKFAQVQAEQKYKIPLKANDRFYVTTKILRESSIQFRFVQDIYRLPDEKICLEASTIGVLVNEKGIPIRPPSDILNLLSNMGVK